LGSRASPLLQWVEIGGHGMIVGAALAERGLVN